MVSKLMLLLMPWMTRTLSMLTFSLLDQARVGLLYYFQVFSMQGDEGVPLSLVIRTWSSNLKICLICADRTLQSLICSKQFFSTTHLTTSLLMKQMSVLNTEANSTTMETKRFLASGMWWWNNASFSPQQRKNIWKTSCTNYSMSKLINSKNTA